MRDPNRIYGFCKALQEMWLRVPDWRFGQLMSNFLGDVVGNTGKDIFFIEDGEMLKYVNTYMSGEPEKQETYYAPSDDKQEIDPAIFDLDNWF